MEAEAWKVLLPLTAHIPMWLRHVDCVVSKHTVPLISGARVVQVFWHLQYQKRANTSAYQKANSPNSLII